MPYVKSWRWYYERAYNIVQYLIQLSYIATIHPSTSRSLRRKADIIAKALNSASTTEEYKLAWRLAQKIKSEL